MKFRRQLYLLIPSVTLLISCSSTSDFMYKPDYDYIQKVEASALYSSQGARVYWVNPPIKRQPRQESQQD